MYIIVTFTHKDIMIIWHGNNELSCFQFQRNVFSKSKTAFEYLWPFYVEKETLLDAPITEESFIRQSEKIFAAITDKDQIQFYLKVTNTSQTLNNSGSKLIFL